MIQFVRHRSIRMLIFPVAALALVLGLSTRAQGSMSQVCGNEGSGYCLNDWGGAAHNGDAVKMYYGGYANDYFFVQDVNRCSGHDTVQSTLRGDATNCPFTNTAFDVDYHGKHIVQISMTNHESECVGVQGASAVLASCANPITGAGGGTGVIQVLYTTQCPDRTLGNVFVNRVLSDENGDTSLVSGGNPGTFAEYIGAASTCWGAFQEVSP